MMQYFTQRSRSYKCHRPCQSVASRWWQVGFAQSYQAAPTPGHWWSQGWGCTLPVTSEACCALTALSNTMDTTSLQAQSTPALPIQTQDDTTCSSIPVWPHLSVLGLALHRHLKARGLVLHGDPGACPLPGGLPGTGSLLFLRQPPWVWVLPLVSWPTSGGVWAPSPAWPLARPGSVVSSLPILPRGLGLYLGLWRGHRSSARNHKWSGFRCRLPAWPSEKSGPRRQLPDRPPTRPESRLLLPGRTTESSGPHCLLPARPPARCGPLPASLLFVITCFIPLETQLHTCLLVGLATQTQWHSPVFCLQVCLPAWLPVCLSVCILNFNK